MHIENTTYSTRPFSINLAKTEFLDEFIPLGIFHFEHDTVMEMPENIDSYSFLSRNFIPGILSSRTTLNTFNPDILSVEYVLFQQDTDRIIFSSIEILTSDLACFSNPKTLAFGVSDALVSLYKKALEFVSKPEFRKEYGFTSKGVERLVRLLQNKIKYGSLVKVNRRTVNIERLEYVLNQLGFTRTRYGNRPYESTGIETIRMFKPINPSVGLYIDFEYEYERQLCVTNIFLSFCKGVYNLRYVGNNFKKKKDNIWCFAHDRYKELYRITTYSVYELIDTLLKKISKRYGKYVHYDGFIESNKGVSPEEYPETLKRINTEVLNPLEEFAQKVKESTFNFNKNISHEEDNFNDFIILLAHSLDRLYTTRVDGDLSKRYYPFYYEDFYSCLCLDFFFYRSNEILLYVDAQYRAHRSDSSYKIFHKNVYGIKLPYMKDFSSFEIVSVIKAVVSSAIGHIIEKVISLQYGILSQEFREMLLRLCSGVFFAPKDFNSISVSFKGRTYIETASPETFPNTYDETSFEYLSNIITRLNSNRYKFE